MLHELIVALYGCPGSVFVESSTGIKVAKGLSYLHPSEIIILDKLCVLGTHYKKLNDFIHLHSYSSGADSKKYFGLYFRVFCNSLNSVLGPYRKALIEVEKEVLQDPYISLTHIQCELDKYYSLFPALDQLIQEFIDKKIHGCLILDLVRTHSISGIPMVKAAMNKILQMCHSQLYKQLSAWMFHGLILDPYNEFFIHLKDTNPQDDPISDLDKYGVNPYMLPSYIISDVAEMILFIGSSSSLFSKKESAMFYLELIFHDKEEQFANNLLSALTEEEFSILQFSNVVDQIRVYSAEHLWKIVVEETNLLSQLCMFKDFYFLGRGELFLTFFDRTRALATLPLGKSSESDLNRAFQFAARSVMSTDDNDAEKFHIKVDAVALDNPNVPERGRVRYLLNHIGLTRDVEWPLHIIFTPDALKKYSQIFRFLLSVRHVQQELHQCWMQEMRGLQCRNSNSNPWHMMFIIDNLQYYLQIDVLESQFSQLVEQFKSEKDFEKIQHAHEFFLNSVLALSFILWKPVHNCLKDIMSTCLEFCHVVSVSSKPLTKEDEVQLCKLINEFQKRTLWLLKTLATARQQHQYQNLGQLFLKIDYNKFFSISGSLDGKCTDE